MEKTESESKSTQETTNKDEANAPASTSAPAKGPESKITPEMMQK